MKISYQWLQDYFSEKLPAPEKTAEVLTLHAFEVEGVEHKGDDYVLDIDVLPNRASDCLNHRGVAKEIALLCGLTFKDREVVETDGNAPSLYVTIEDPYACRRYVAKKILNVKVGPSPQWLVDRLEALGQRSVNNVVDATNFVMFDMGQPLHAFDADKVVGDIVVRKAQEGETISLLGEEDARNITPNMQVIADSEGPIALAGVKGGKRAEVDENTSSIILEAANFSPTITRKTARQLDLLTDAAKRFENEITPQWAGEAMTRVTQLILEIAGTDKTTIEKDVNVYPNPPMPYKRGISLSEVNAVLGTTLSENELEHILEQFEKSGFEWEAVEDPLERVIEVAQSLKGAAYTYGASISRDAPNAFDCSSFINYIYLQAGVTLPRIAVDQYFFGMEVAQDELKPGDVVFSRNAQPKDLSYVRRADGKEVVDIGARTKTVEFLDGSIVEGGVSHNGLYVGDGKIMHAHPDKGVVLEDLREADKFAHIVGARRMVANAHKRYIVGVPYERIDLRAGNAFLVSGNVEDLIEEIGRVYGYENIGSQLPDISYTPTINKIFYYVSRIRLFLAVRGFSEVCLYTFCDKGDIELANPLAQGKEFLRTNLSDGLKAATEANEKNAPLLTGAPEKIFEIGHVFTKKAEERHLAIGGADRDTISALSAEMGVEIPTKDSKKGEPFEINLEEIVANAPEPKSYDGVLAESPEVKYMPFSAYPFVLRDIAVWMPAGSKPEELLSIIQEHAGDLLVRSRLFDTYEKNDRISYAYNLVFQSPEKTLTDDEVNDIMDVITNVITQKGWEVR